MCFKQDCNESSKHTIISHKTLPTSTYCDGDIRMPHTLRYIDDRSALSQCMRGVVVSEPVTAYHWLVYRFCQTFDAMRNGLWVHRLSFEAFAIGWEQPFTAQRGSITIQRPSYRCFQHDFPMFVPFGAINT